MKAVKFGVIGCGLMGREFASAVSRWCHLLNMEVKPEIIGVCDANSTAMDWFKEQLPSVRFTPTDYHELLKNEEVDAIYCAVPHNLHKQIYIDIIHSGKHLLGEKPFGIDQQANMEILAAVEQNPTVIVRGSSEIPFFPGAFHLFELVRDGFVGQIIEVEAGFWHSSDLNPEKPINWKRRIETNGEYGCMGDLGMHVLHLPLRLGWRPNSVRALLSNLVKERPNQAGEMVPCKTWDNAILACDVRTNTQEFPMVLSMKRIAPGHANTWFIRVAGMQGSIEFSTKNPKQLRTMKYKPGGQQAWNIIDAPYESAYRSITGSIFEFGFSDSILQMWAAFCDEVVNGKFNQSLHCVTPQETAESHAIFTAALASQKSGQTVQIDYGLKSHVV
ncbi:Gfo/Idh/MocA family protein [Neobacillus ginsengisoli]|uniref:Dehydrogenase n=1 Tax=Neobacillus ginsengisoli TaxID=904295 RepID=A0ABT9XXM2_9BACI|nr:Gfo/Idh/MocA family oxidoreductase [Neobacillus ginsengisoli]MDQ0200259.1 putative dehydrogenase [Neobacillus ginsengisoli]